jgi:Lrp/AsnC family transcriptional regulator, leucine-responsive regulatory protein
MMKLDEIDFRMLEILQTEGRIPVLELADRVGLSPTPCSRRLRRLESEGIIAKYYAAVDPKAVGLDVMAFVSVRIRHSAERAAQFTAAIQKMPDVRGCYRLTGNYDYLLRVHTIDMQSFSRWLQDRLHVIPSVLHTHTSIIMESIKDDPVFPLASFATFPAGG